MKIGVYVGRSCLWIFLVNIDFLPIFLVLS